jgi:hypothetical protein
MATFKLQYVNSYTDARGKLRNCFRRKGHKRVTIKGKPGSPEFMEMYHALLDQTGGALSVAEIGALRTKAGTIDALVVRYTYETRNSEASHRWHGERASKI